jgi:crotonobetainyl-CoA:carnitine CoA-transferase CaiB-like acyl-CoA transferase
MTFFGIDIPATQHPNPIGHDTSAILSECGYSADEIKTLFDCGAAGGK